MGWGGVGLGLVGLALRQPFLTSLGLIGYEIGVPLMGSGAGRMIRSRNLLDTTFAPSSDGWTAYWIGTAVEGAAIGVLAISIPIFILSREEGDESLDAVLFHSRNMALAGVALHAWAWVRFGIDAERAEESNRQGPFHVAILPIGLGPNGDLQPGATLSLAF